MSAAGLQGQRLATVGAVLPTVVRRGLVLGIAVVVLSAACGDDGEDGEDGEDDDAAEGTDTASDETTTSTTTTTTSPATTTTTPPAGGDDGGGDGSGGGGAAAPIVLDVEVTADGQVLRRGSVSCGDGDTASGTGFIADPATAQAACALLRDDAAARRRLVEGQDPDLLCTQIYGGPEVARVRGEIDGQPVDATVDRTDGCGIAAWELLGPLFGLAGG